MRAPLPTDPTPVPPPWPKLESLCTQGAAAAEQLRSRKGQSFREARNVAKEEHGVPGPTSQVYVHRTEPTHEREFEIAGEYEEVHCNRLAQLFAIYADRQEAGGKPCKKLSGSKFWIAGKVVQLAVVTSEGARLLLADASGKPFVMVASWLGFEAGDNTSAVQQAYHQVDKMFQPGTTCVLRAFKFEINKDLELVVHANKGHRGLQKCEHRMPLGAKQAVSFVAELRDYRHLGPLEAQRTAEDIASMSLLGLGAAATEMGDTHVLLLQNIAQGCLKLQQNVLALIYASTAMRVRDRHGRVPAKAAYRAALAAWRLGMPHCIAFILAQVERDACDEAIAAAIAALLRKSYKAVIAQSGDSALMAMLVPSLPMAGGYQLAHYLSEHMATLRKHLAAQACAMRAKVESEAESHRENDRDSELAQDDFVHQYACRGLKDKGNQLFKQGNTQQALLMWGLALNAAQMPVDDGNGAIFGPRQDEVAAQWRNRVPELLKGLHCASTSGVAGWQAQQRVAAFFDLMAATVLTSPTHTTQAERDRLAALHGDLHSRLSNDETGLSGRAQQHHDWGSSFPSLQPGRASDVEAEMEALARAGPDTVPGAEGLPPDKMAAFRAGQALEQGYDASRRAQRDTERAYMAELSAAGGAGGDGSGAHERAAAAAERVKQEAHSKMVADPDTAAILRLQKDFGAQLDGAGSNEAQERLLAQAADTAYSVPEVQRRLAAEQQQRRQQQQQQRLRQEEGQAEGQPPREAAPGAQRASSAEQPSSPLGSDHPFEFTFQAPAQSAGQACISKDVPAGAASSKENAAANGSAGHAGHADAPAAATEASDAKRQAATAAAAAQAGAWMYWND